jgi:formate/nitrite transporter FocA (FNT family)
VVRLIAGLAFSLGLVLVIVGGAELFTGNALIVMAWASRRVSSSSVFRNWAIVYAGNLVGALATAAVLFISGRDRAVAFARHGPMASEQAVAPDRTRRLALSSRVVHR